MKLVGTILQGIGGFTTIRGFASMEEIVRVSKAEEFQRILIPNHVKEIQDFYQKATALYFPEIVLAYTLSYNYAKGSSGTNPMRDILEKKISNQIQIK